MDMPKDYKVILAGGAVLLGALWFVSRQAGKVADAAVNAGGYIVDTSGGLLTGNNVITAAARTDAYKGWGVLGTLGAAVDNVGGGVFSRIGETIGGKIYDWTN